MLDAAIALGLGDLDLDVAFRAHDGEVVALLGPNGAGKTTIVRALAGLVAIDRGHIRLGPTTLDDPAADVFVAPEDRSVGVVFQDYLLFPRMSARDNVAFGLRARGLDRASANEQAVRWLDRFGVADRAHARPGELSGGQAQRVALARALATEPALLLLDEPLAALDASTRVHVRAELRRHLADVESVRVLVTHDPIDALVLADRLVVVEDGRVSQRGTPAEIAARPATPYVADLVGINLLHGRLDDHTVRLAGGGDLAVAPAEAVPEGPVAVAIRPQAVSLYLERPDGSPRNTWATEVVGIDADRDRLRVGLGAPIPLTAEVTPAAVDELGLRPGREVWASIKAVDITVYER